MRTASHITNALSAANARSIGPSGWLHAGARLGAVSVSATCAAVAVESRPGVAVSVVVAPTSTVPVVGSMAWSIVDCSKSFTQKRGDRSDRSVKLKPV